MANLIIVLKFFLLCAYGSTIAKSSNIAASDNTNRYARSQENVSENRNNSSVSANEIARLQRVHKNSATVFTLMKEKASLQDSEAAKTDATKFEENVNEVDNNKSVDGELPTNDKQIEMDNGEAHGLCKLHRDKACLQIYEYPGPEFYVKGPSFTFKSAAAQLAVDHCYNYLYTIEDYQAMAAVMKSHYGCDLTHLWKLRAENLRLPFNYHDERTTRKLPYSSPSRKEAGDLRVLGRYSENVKYNSDDINNSNGSFVADNTLRCQKSAVAQLCMAVPSFLSCLMHQFHAIPSSSPNSRQPSSDESSMAKADIGAFVRESCTVYRRDILGCDKVYAEVSTREGEELINQACKNALEEIGSK